MTSALRLASYASSDTQDLDMTPWVDQIMNRHPKLTRIVVDSFLKDLTASVVRSAGSDNFVYAFLGSVPIDFESFVRRQYVTTSEEAQVAAQSEAYNLLLAIFAGLDPVKTFLGSLTNLFKLGLQIRPPAGDDNGGDGDDDGGDDPGPDGPGKHPEWRTIKRCP